MIYTQNSNVQVDEIIGIRGFSLDRVLESDAGFLKDDQDHQHDQSVSSVGIECAGECDQEKLNSWIATLLRERGTDIFRTPLGLRSILKKTTLDGNKLDGVIIETTGLADPAPVAQTFFADDVIQARMTLDGIITVVDAKHCLQHLHEEKPDGVENEAVEQLAFADRIIVNKTDLVRELSEKPYMPWVSVLRMEVDRLS